MSDDDIKAKLRKAIINRGMLVPIVEYDDGSQGWGVPGIFTEPVEAWQRLQAGASDNIARMQQGLPFDPQSAGDALAVTGAAAMGSVAAPRPTGAFVASGAPSGQAPKGIRAYHGSPNEFDAFSEDAPHWFSTDRRTAEAFGKDRMGLDHPGSSYHNASAYNAAKPKIYDVDIDAANFTTIDPWDEASRIAGQIGVDPPKSWDDVATILNWGQAQKGWLDDAKAAGRAGVIFKNVGDDPSGALSDHIAVLSPGHVRSSTTGELLYANPKESAALGAAVQGDDGSRNYVAFDDKLISIVRKYGIAGAAAMYGVSDLDIMDAMQEQGL